MSGSADAGRLLVRIEATTAQLRQQLQAAEQQVAGTTAKIDGQLKQADRAFARLEDASKSAQSAIAGLSGRLGPLGGVLTALGPAGIAAGVGIAALSAGLVAVAKAGDIANATLARLTSATGSAAQAQQVYEGLFRLSQQTGIAVAESAGAFSRFAVAAKDIGGTSDQVLRLVAGIQKAGIVAGSSTEETKAAVQQLGQALASGTLQGDELRSLLENMPQLAQSLARELGVSIGQLRQMGSEGKLTADTVFPALLRAAEKMNAEFEKMPPTLGRAFAILGESMANFAANLDHALGLSQAIARAVRAAADAVDNVRARVLPNDREQADRAVADAQRQLDQVRAQIAAERAASAYGDIAPGLRQAEEIATAELSEALRNQQALRRDAREMERAESADAARQAADTRRTRLGIEIRDVAEFADKRRKIARETAEKLKKIDDAVAAGVTTMGGSPGIPGARFDAERARAGVLREQAEALAALAKEEAKGGEEARKAAEKRQHVITTLDEQVRAAQAALDATKAGTAGSREMAIALETEGKLREAGIPAIEKRTEAEKKAAEAIAASVRKLDELKESSKKAEEAAKKLTDFHNKSSNELAAIGERAFDRLGDAIVNAFVNGQGAAVNFGNIARGVLSSIVADIAKLAIVNPILNSLFTSSSGPRATLAGAFGGGATSLGGLGSLGSLFSGFGSLFSGASDFLFGQSAVGALGPQIPTSGLLGSGGSLFGTTGLGGLFQGAGLGAGIGGITASLLGGNAAYGSIGGGLGALLGQALIPIPGVGAIIGGLLGGAGGGLIGPGPSVKGYGLRLQSSAFDPNSSNYYAPGDSLAPIDRTFYNETGAAAFQQAEAIVSAVNAYMAQQGLQVGGASILGGNKNGADYSSADSGTLAEAFAKLRFSAKDNAQLTGYLSGQSFDDPAKLQAAVDGFQAAQAAIEALTAEAVPAFTAQLKAVNDNFDAATEQARKYGLAEDGLATARTKALAELEASRAETLRQIDASLAVRRLTAAGDTQGAALAQQAEAATRELDSFTNSMDALAITAGEKSAYLVTLEETQAAERAAIIKRYGEQANADLTAGQSLLRDLAFGAGSALAPEQKYFAALSTLNQAKHDLDAGGSLAQYSAVAAQVLPVARDYLGTSQRYAGLAAEVGQVLASRGADGAGLSSILSAQVDGMAGMQTTFAAYGDLQVNALQGLRADFQRLAATVEALITRRSAA